MSHSNLELTNISKYRVKRFPSVFKEVARVLREVKTYRKSLKSAVYSSRCRGKVLKKVYGMASSVLSNMSAVNFIMKEVKFCCHSSMPQEIFEVLVNEVVKKHRLPGKSLPVIVVNKYRQQIENAYSQFKSQNSSELCNTNSIHVPRYARIQTVVTTIDALLKFLQNDGYVQKHASSDVSLERYHEEVKNLKTGEFMLDRTFGDVLVFSKNENLCDLQLYKHGNIFLQDKASYLAVHALNPEQESIVLDCCAAPGMKTAHLACVMKNTGQIYAIDKDATRLVTLKKTLKHGSVKNCTFLCEDFTNINPKQEPYCFAQYILVDPSCSGSGMVERMSYDISDVYSHDPSRIGKLAEFQIALLKHALSFPCAKRIVYSTCSVYEEENEYVVEEALKVCSSTFQLAFAVPSWPTRGSKKYKIGNLCIRASPKENLTKGFFVAVFERIIC